MLTCSNTVTDLLLTYKAHDLIRSTALTFRSLLFHPCLKPVIINIFIMKSFIAKEVVNGVYKMVQYITYSNGSRVKRVLGKNGIPESVEQIKGK